MRLFLLSDTHLPLSKPVCMSPMGEHWRDHHLKMQQRWDAVVQPEDVVLVPGDVSWAPSASRINADMEWFRKRPGQVWLSKGNHDRWWRSERRLAQLVPRNVKTVHEYWRPFQGGIIAGLEGGTCPGDRWFRTREKKRWPEVVTELRGLVEKLAEERERWQAGFAILMIHYPPFNDKGEPGELSDLIEQAGVDLCVYGHFHRPYEWANTWNGPRNGVVYAFGASDARDYTPLCLGRIAQRELTLEPVPPPPGPREMRAADGSLRTANAEI